MAMQHAVPSLERATMLHRLLLGGTVMIALVFGSLVLTREGGLIPDGQVVGYVLAGVSALAQLVGWMLLRPRIEPRPAAMPEPEYWRDTDRFGRAMILWTATEGASIIALVGWLLSGNLAALAVAMIGIGLLVMYRPAVLAGR